MTFEEAIEHLDNVKEAESKDYTDKFGHFDELAFELKNYRLWAREVHKTIDKLQSTDDRHNKSNGKNDFETNIEMARELLKEVEE